MSDNDSTSDRICYKKDEHFLFVTLLEKYKVLLRTEKNPEFKEKKMEAATALSNEYNRKCGRKFTVEQVFKKVYNMKGRLRTKNFKNLRRSKKLTFTSWERKFLDLWVENGLTSSSKRNSIYDIVMASQTEVFKSQPPAMALKEDISDASSQHESYASEGHTNLCSMVINDASKSESYTSEGFIIPDNVKIETDAYNAQTTSEVHEMTSTPIDSESESDLIDEDYNDSYAKMSLIELKRAALIAEIESHKAQKEAAEAQKSAAESQKKAAEINKELNEYQFTFLRRQNGDD